MHIILYARLLPACLVQLEGPMNVVLSLLKLAQGTSPPSPALESA